MFVTWTLHGAFFDNPSWTTDWISSLLHRTMNFLVLDCIVTYYFVVCSWRHSALFSRSRSLFFLAEVAVLHYWAAIFTKRSHFRLTCVLQKRRFALSSLMSAFYELSGRYKETRNALYGRQVVCGVGKGDWNQLVFWGKQQLCTRITLFSTFLCTRITLFSTFLCTLRRKPHNAKSPYWIDENYACGIRSSPRGGRSPFTWFRTGTKFSLLCSNRGEPEPAWHFLMVSCKPWGKNQLLRV